MAKQQTRKRMRIFYRYALVDNQGYRRGLLSDAPRGLDEKATTEDALGFPIGSLRETTVRIHEVPGVTREQVDATKTPAKKKKAKN